MQYLPGDDEHLRALVNSRGWKLILRLLMTTRDNLVRELIESDQGEPHIANLRGWIRGFQLVAEFPKMLMDEIKEGVPTED